MCAALLGCQKETPNQEPVVLDTPVLSSSDITSSGFTVAWGGVEHASAYAYTLSTADGTVSSDENYAVTYHDSGTISIVPSSAADINSLSAGYYSSDIYLHVVSTM